MSDHDVTIENPLALDGLAANLLAEAREHHAGRAASTVLTGASLRATVIALLSGGELAEHEAPPAATLHVLSGSADLVAGDDRWAVRAGELIAIPQRRHSLHATSDTVVLLTVALH